MAEEQGGRDKAELEAIVGLALAEDLGSDGDITSGAIFVSGEEGTALVVAREPCVVSGLMAAEEVCRQVGGIAYLPLVRDGQEIPAAAEIMRLQGSVLSIFAAERTLLNFISRLSGIATISRRFVDAADGMAQVASTRKTGPGMRRLEKNAVVHGGGVPHRIGLYDSVLIKDNHIAAAGGLKEAVTAVADRLGDDIDIEVEVDTIEQLREAMETTADAALLDNMTPAQVRQCVELAGGRLRLEASGGIGLDNIREYAGTGVDMVSVGHLTRSAPGIDFSLEVSSER